MSLARDIADLGSSATRTAGSNNKNFIINSAMNVAQRATSVTGIGASDGYFTVDRFKIDVDAASAGRLTMSQHSDGPSGFANCIKLDCTTADTSIAAGERLILRHIIEGQDLQRLKKGTSDAESFTISFYVKGNAAATYSLSLYDGDNGRSISQTFSVTTSWNRIELTFAGDTTGAFGDDNGASLYLDIFLHAGSSYTSGTLGTSWASNDNATRAVGISSFFDSTDREFFITGYQMEVGSATDFEHRSFAQELQLCQRYYEKSFNQGVAPAVGVLETGADFNIGSIAYTTTNSRTPVIKFSVSKRANPTVVQYHPQGYGTHGSNNKAAIYFSGSWQSPSASTASLAHDQFFVNLTVSSGLTAGDSYLTAVGWSADSEL